MRFEIFTPLSIVLSFLAVLIVFYVLSLNQGKTLPIRKDPSKQVLYLKPGDRVVITRDLAEFIGGGLWVMKGVKGSILQVVSPEDYGDYQASQGVKVDEEGFIWVRQEMERGKHFPVRFEGIPQRPDLKRPGLAIECWVGQVVILSSDCLRRMQKYCAPAQGT